MARDFGMLFIISHTAPLAGLLGLALLPMQPPVMWALCGAGLALAWIAMSLLAILLCRIGGYPVRRMRGAILMFPLFMASWMPLQILALFVPVRSWSEIKHHGQKDAR